MYNNKNLTHNLYNNNLENQTSCLAIGPKQPKCSQKLPISLIILSVCTPTSNSEPFLLDC